MFVHKVKALHAVKDILCAKNLWSYKIRGGGILRYLYKPQKKIKSSLNFSCRLGGQYLTPKKHLEHSETQN